MARKSQLYNQLLERISQALHEGRYVETSWYAYAVIEDRLRSLLENTGGVPSKPRHLMLGTKLALLHDRATTHAALRARLPYVAIKAWASDRNDLMHAMADGKATIEDIDARMAQLAIDGEKLARDLAASARAVKRYGRK